MNGNNNKLAFNIRYIDVNNNKERWNLCFSFIDVILLLLDITLCSVVVVVVGWRLGFACSHVSLSGGFMSDDRAHGTQNRRCRVLYTSVKLVMNEYLPTSSEIFYIIFFLSFYPPFYIIHTFDDDGVHTYSSLGGKNLEDKWPTMREKYIQVE